MKKLFIAAIMSLSLLTTSTFAEIKIGIILGFTGPIESLTPAMRESTSRRRNNYCFRRRFNLC